MGDLMKNRITRHDNVDPNTVLDNPANFRRHPEYQVRVMEGALDEIGWIQNIIINDRTGLLIDGHLRVEIARRRGEPTVPAVIVDLSPEEEAIALASLDPISALATTDQGALDELLMSIQANNDALLELFGELMSQGAHNAEEDGLGDDDAVPEPNANQVISKPGDVWILGDHRLMCGDALNPADLERLMDGKTADMVWTDPPYNVDYEGTAGKIQNDAMAEGAFREFLAGAFTNMAAHTREGGGVYIAHAASTAGEFIDSMKAAGLLHKQTLVWVKDSFTLGRQDYQWKHEPILYGWKAGAAHYWHGEFDKSTVVDYERPLEDMKKDELLTWAQGVKAAIETDIVRIQKPKKNAEHPTMKPVDLVARMVKNSSRRGQAVLDIFGGSGSTLIAAEKTGRKAYILELDPVFCDVIIQRYRAYTGRDAYRADGAPFTEIECAA